MSETYFSDRDRGERPRTAEDVPLTVWAALVDLVDERILDGALGHGFPEFCPDGAGCCGCDSRKLARRLKAEIPELDWPLSTEEAPEIAPMMDLLEFCARNIGEPIEGGWHSFFGHHHLGHDAEAGRAAFRPELDRLFRRNGVAFEMDENGLMHRLAPEGLREALIIGRFQTGDGALDRLLETARSKFLSPKIETRREALESLWDAFERLKTVDALAISVPALRPCWMARRADRGFANFSKPKLGLLLRPETRFRSAIMKSARKQSRVRPRSTISSIGCSHSPNCSWLLAADECLYR